MSAIQLKQVILKYSYSILERKGISAIRMRDLAKSCNCAIGTLYNVFETFEDIHYHLNLQTFRELMERLLYCLEKGITKKLSIQELLSSVGWEYIAFAKEKTNSWKALFECTPKSDPPNWYLKEFDQYFEMVEKILKRNLLISGEKIEKLIHYFWFSIHGISSIVLNKKAIQYSNEFIQPYMEHCLRGIYTLI